MIVAFQCDGARFFVLIEVPDIVVRESKERLRKAIMNAGLGITRTQSSTRA